MKGSTSPEIAELWTEIAGLAADQKKLAEIVDRALANSERVIAAVENMSKALDIAAGTLKITESRVNDLTLQESESRSRTSKLEAMVDGAIASAISPLVKEFLAEVKEERRFFVGGLRRLLDGEEIE